MSDPAKRVVCFIDAENLVISAQTQGIPVNIKRIIDRVREEGVLCSARAYADWTLPSTRPYLNQFYDNVVELTQLGSSYGKNTSDMQIVLDALELATGVESPDIFVIVSGDRDFVPLILKLKRYGKFVLGIGLAEATSKYLRSACDHFLSYENLVLEHTKDEESKLSAELKPSPGTDQPISQEVEDAFNLLLRSVTSLERVNKIPIGTSVSQLMHQLDPEFDLSKLPFPKFKALVESAEKHKYVSIVGLQGLDIKIESVKQYEAKDEEPLRFLSTTSHSTSETLLFYRQALAAKRVPIIPWRERQMLIRNLWSVFESRDDGMTFADIAATMTDYSASQLMYISRQSIEKMIFSLNLGHAIQFIEDGLDYKDIDFHQDMVKPACGIDEALQRMNLTYIVGIQHHDRDLPLQPRPLALLLFDSDNDADIKAIDFLLEKL